MPRRGPVLGRNVQREWLAETRPGQDVKKQPSSLYNALAEDVHLRLWVERSIWGRGKDTESQIDGLMSQAVRYFLNEKLYETDKKMVGDKSPLSAPGIVAEIARIVQMPRLYISSGTVATGSSLWSSSSGIGTLQKVGSTALQTSNAKNATATVKIPKPSWLLARASLPRRAFGRELPHGRSM